MTLAIARAMDLSVTLIAVATCVIVILIGVVMMYDAVTAPMTATVVPPTVIAMDVLPALMRGVELTVVLVTLPTASFALTMVMLCWWMESATVVRATTITGMTLPTAKCVCWIVSLEILILAASNV